MTYTSLLKRASEMTSKIAFVSLCAIALGGCAQFEGSFGQLRDLASLSRTTEVSDSQKSAPSRDNSSGKSDAEKGKVASASVERSFTLGGIQVEFADGHLSN